MGRITPQSLLFSFRDPDRVLVDVRSPSEFSQGCFPGSINIPLLNDSHRHQVGLTYKTKGQSAAIELGHSLVDPIRGDLIRQWRLSIGEKRALVFCWRGGLRSQISTQWMEEAGVDCVRVEGGYRSIRQQLLRVLEFPPALVVLAGETGSGKTELLGEFEDRLDLEQLAAHRGSTFGSITGESQPCQTTFENAIATGLWGRIRPTLVEDESRFIGRCRLPHWFYQAKESAPMIALEEPIESRVQRIYQGYVLDTGVEPGSLYQKLSGELGRLGKALGGARTTLLQGQLREAFEEPSESAHHVWIRGLLEEYYDPRYRWAMEKRKSVERFRGDRSACRRWLKRKGFY